jgi:hypothetical protein
MAFCLRKPVSPFDQWVKHGSPKRAVFKCYKDAIYRYNYLPAKSILFISADFGYACYTLDALVELKVDRQNKTLNIARASGYSNNYWTDTWMEFVDDFPPNGWVNGTDFIRCLKKVGGQRLLDSIRRHFFGEEWSWNRPSDDDDMIAGLPSDVCEEAYICECAFDDSEDMFVTENIPFNKVMVYIDNIPERNAAAIKIQAGVKGWKARMAYRLNPYTTLGKHLALKAGGFL